MTVLPTLAALAVAATLTPTAPPQGAICSPPMDSSFVRLLPSTKPQGTVLQPLAARHPTGAVRRPTDRGCAHLIG